MHRIARYSRKDESLVVIDALTGQESARYEHGTIYSLTRFAFSGDGRVLAFGGDSGLVRVWHLDPPRDLGPLPGHAPKEAWSLAFAPTARPSPAPAMMGSSDSGNAALGPGRKSPHRPLFAGHLHRLLAGRPTPGQRRLRQHGPALGREDGRRPRDPRGASGQGPRRGVLPGQPHARLGG